MHTCSPAWTPSKALTGPRLPRHTPTWRRPRPSYPSRDKHLDSMSSLPQPTLPTSKGSSCRCTPLSSSTSQPPACPPEESSRTWRERDSPGSSRHSQVRYLIIHEMSMVGRKTLGQMDRRLRQAFPHHSQKVFRGYSCLLFGDFGQLPPVMDLPLYTTDSCSELSDQGRLEPPHDPHSHQSPGRLSLCLCPPPHPDC